MSKAEASKVEPVPPAGRRNAIAWLEAAVMRRR